MGVEEAVELLGGELIVMVHVNLAETWFGIPVNLPIETNHRTNAGSDIASYSSIS